MSCVSSFCSPSFHLRDDDDINDVASMAGVNLNEENARILATSSELVGTKIRSCKDESFLPTGLLHRRILDTGTVSPATSDDLRGSARSVTARPHLSDSKHFCLTSVFNSNHHSC